MGGTVWIYYKTLMFCKRQGYLFEKFLSEKKKCAWYKLQLGGCDKMQMIVWWMKIKKFNQIHVKLK